jgi:hypothetical protein
MATDHILRIFPFWQALCSVNQELFQVLGQSKISYCLCFLLSAYCLLLSYVEIVLDILSADSVYITAETSSAKLGR